MSNIIVILGARLYGSILETRSIEKTWQDDDLRGLCIKFRHVPQTRQLIIQLTDVTDRSEPTKGRLPGVYPIDQPNTAYNDEPKTTDHWHQIGLPSRQLPALS